MKGLIILANGFEDTEALTTIDILSRAKIALDKVNMESSKEVVTQYQNVVLVPLKFDEISEDDYDFLIIPGGKAVKEKLYNDKRVEKLVRKYASEQKLICAICAGPMVIGKHGYFANKKFTCFSGCEKGISGIYTNEGVTVSGNFITAKSMAYTIEFALEIVKKLLGKETMEKVKKSIYSL
ncbi:MAG: hypothetical protein BHW12_01145 [Coprobacillus sp. 28_7]|nr:MAG: hypothetical protein BHW12_01145 [Coprobacillus sp. 28_7]CCY08094.1 dJ-1 family protein [Coprobacillus sp. CAG:698]